MISTSSFNNHTSHISDYNSTEIPANLLYCSRFPVEPHSRVLRVQIEFLTRRNKRLILSYGRPGWPLKFLWELKLISPCNKHNSCQVHFQHEIPKWERRLHKFRNGCLMAIKCAELSFRTTNQLSCDNVQELYAVIRPYAAPLAPYRRRSDHSKSRNRCGTGQRTCLSAPLCHIANWPLLSLQIFKISVFTS